MTSASTIKTVYGVVDVIPRRTRYGIVGVVVLIAAWWIIAAVAAPGRISPDLRAAVAERPAEHFDIEITFNAGPTRFHMDRYQQHGQLGRVEHNVLVLRRVEGSHVELIARDYWIERIAPHDP